MFVHHRAALAIGGAAAITLTVVALHASASTPAPGPSISWAQPAAVASASPSAVSGVEQIPSAPASPPAGTGPLAGLQIPLSAMFHQLNSETKDTAVGQYSILQSIENTLREQIESFLRWVTGGR
jgi:hypothetical protein